MFMKKILTIEGMTCAHCEARVTKALTAISGVKATVSAKKKSAEVSFESEVADSVLQKALEDAGYKVTDIKEKKSLFGR